MSTVPDEINGDCSPIAFASARSSPKGGARNESVSARDQLKIARIANEIHDFSLIVSSFRSANSAIKTAAIASRKFKPGFPPKQLSDAEPELTAIG